MARVAADKADLKMSVRSMVLLMEPFLSSFRTLVTRWEEPARADFAIDYRVF